MIAIIQNNVPRCPQCSAAMFIRIQNQTNYMICNDCGKIYEVADNGQAEIEIIISDTDMKNS